MYLEHFGLNEFPFSITPSTHFFFASETSQVALITLLTAIKMGEGFMKITGEVGTGKTMLCRKLLGSLDEDYAVCYIFNPYLEPLALFIEIATELGLPFPQSTTINQHEVLNALTRRVFELNESGKRVVICLDEVQAMPIETLEALRLLTNLETENRKLLQVIIFGQPELDECLNHPSVRQLRQRITFHYRLKPLSNSEFNYYVQHRLAAAGHRRGQLFTPTALWLLRRKSRCIPRLINILANKALLSAYGRGKNLVGWNEVMHAANDTDSVNEGPPNRLWFMSLATVALVIASFPAWRHWL
jgi:MSHA biogenesis protein MshM